MTSTADVERNLDAAVRLVAEAAARGATFVGLPENFAFLRSEGEPVPERAAARRALGVPHGRARRGGTG